MKKMDPDTFLKKAAPLIILLIIFSSALWFRSFPARFSEIQALDPFFFYRMGLEVMDNNWQLGIDYMRYHPSGVDTAQYHYLIPIYLPAFVYTLLVSLGMNMHYLHFAIMWPAWLGALACIPMYFLGKELYSKKAGLFAAFFLAVVPAFITRTSAGFFEKEPIAGVFIVGSVYFFVRAFKRGSWLSGIVAGACLAMVSLAWGGVQYIYMLYAGFLGLIFLANLILVVLDYVFTGFGRYLKSLEKYLSMDMIKAYLPLILIGTLVQQLFARRVPLDNISIIVSFTFLAILLIKYGAERFKLVKEEYVPYVVPAVLVILVAGSLVGAMFIDSLADNVSQVISLVTFSKSVISTTVAENAPGDWGSIGSVTGTSFTKSAAPWLGGVAPYLSIWVFMFLGAGLLIYRFFRTREWIILLPVVWLLSSIVGVFYVVRLVFLMGPPAALCAGILLAWIIERAMRLKYFPKLSSLSTKGNFILPILLAIFIFLAVAVNFANAYTYSLNLGPSICFPRYNSDDPFDVQPCVTIGENREEVLAPNQPWYEAFTYLANQTPEDSSVLSWWDFGYWFQVRGERPSIADGGHTGGAYARTDRDIAEWYVDDADNWDSYREWFVERDVDYILMDYTLPGKYGAISKIASDGQQIVGMLQFQQKSIEPRTNDSIYIFANGQYEIWLPLDNQGIMTGTPMFLVKQNGQYIQKSYINEVCTKAGITKAGNQDPALQGCVAVSDLGVYYIPQEAYRSVFTNLMFMDAAGLPLNKVFDNQLVKIYEVDYDAWEA